MKKTERIKELRIAAAEKLVEISERQITLEHLLHMYDRGWMDGYGDSNDEEVHLTVLLESLKEVFE